MKNDTQIRGDQVAAARGMLNLSREALSRKAGVAPITIRYFERGMRQTQPAMVAALRLALERHGIEFICRGIRRRDR